VDRIFLELKIAKKKKRRGKKKKTRKMTAHFLALFFLMLFAVFFNELNKSRQKNRTVIGEHKKPITFEEKKKNNKMRMKNKRE
jgi:hypothetical protein